MSGLAESETTRRASARRSSSDRTAPSPTSARTSRISSGSSGCSGATSTTAGSEPGPTASVLWATSADTPAMPSHPPFGRADATYNVIDVRQSYLQKLLKQALRRSATPSRPSARRTSRTRWWRCRTPRRGRSATSPPDATDDKRAFVEVSGRKGQGVKADDLLDTPDRDAPRPKWPSAIPSSPPPSSGASPR